MKNKCLYYNRCLPTTNTHRRIAELSLETRQETQDKYSRNTSTPPIHISKKAQNMEKSKKSNVPNALNLNGYPAKVILQVKKKQNLKAKVTISPKDLVGMFFAQAEIPMLTVAPAEPCLTATLLIRSPCYYAHIILVNSFDYPNLKAQSVILLFKVPI